MPAGLSALIEIVGGVGAQLLSAFTAIFQWAFASTEAGGLTNWPVLITIVMMFLIFVINTCTNLVRGAGK